MEQRWSKPSVMLHWATAVLVTGLVVAGLVMSDLDPKSEMRLLLSRLHTVFGFLLVLLTVARLVARKRKPAPPPIPLGGLHRTAVDLVHGLMYVVTFALGATGVGTALRSAWPSYIRGELAQAPALEELAPREVHETLAFVLLGLVALHVVGVVVQQVHDRATLRRMIPFLR